MNFFVRGPNPIWFFNDLVGQSVDDTYYAFFLNNDLPYNFVTVYQDPAHTIPWANPIDFQANAGLPNNIFLDPAQVYRIEIREGQTQVDPLIYLIENYSVGNTGEPTDDLLSASNMITNPQFADVYFTSPYTISVAGTYEIGPGWSIQLTGTGSTVLNQIPLDGNSNEPGSPPYYLEITNSGWGSAKLIQKFSNNGAIFSNGAVGGSFTAFSTGTPENITMIYSPSVGASTDIVSDTVATGAFQEYSDATNLPASTNTDVDGEAFVDIILALPETGVVALTNIQLIGQSVPLSQSFISDPTFPQFEEITYERTVDQEFHVYKNSLLQQPKDNLLVGWNFALNPWQFYSKTHGNVAANEYTADQTIIVQQAYVTSATGNNVFVSQSGVSNNRAYDVAAVTNTNKFAIIQYISPSTIKQYWGKILSSMVNVLFSSPSIVTILHIKMRLIYRSGSPFLPPTISQHEPITSWTNVDGSDPVFSSNWTAIVPENDPSYLLNDSVQSLSFNKLQLPTCLDDNMTLGIVIYTLENMDTTSPDSVLFQDVSLVNNDFAIQASTETYDETLRKCQFYYETSYESGSSIGTATLLGVQYASNPLAPEVSSGALELYKNSFQINFKTIKQDIPSIFFYSPMATELNNIQIGIYDGTAYPNSGSFSPNPRNLSISNWTASEISHSNIQVKPNNNTVVISVASTNVGSLQGEMLYHYVADSRLGR